MMRKALKWTSEKKYDNMIHVDQYAVSRVLLAL